jgi:hypothetical protein
MRRSGLLIVVPLLAGALPAGSAPVAQATGSGCRPWQSTALFTGLGVLEYLLPDGTGGLLISNQSDGAVERLATDGSRTTVIAGMNGPGALSIVNGNLFAVDGDSAESGIENRTDGSVLEVNLTSGAQSAYSSGLAMPNGMAFSAAGDAYISRDIAPAAGANSTITRVPAGDPGAPELNWANLGDTNGVAVDSTQTWLYASTTFDALSRLYRIRLADPSDIQLEAALLVQAGQAPIYGMDDMVMGPGNVLYIAANGSGQVVTYDTNTGAACIIASGLHFTSAVVFGDGTPEYPADDLFVCGFDGTILKLSPPV